MTLIGWQHQQSENGVCTVCTTTAADDGCRTIKPIVKKNSILEIKKKETKCAWQSDFCLQEILAPVADFLISREQNNGRRYEGGDEDEEKKQTV